jgi:UDP-glucose 4-epimerase
MHVLVTGGAGYVGGNVVRALIDAGHDVSVIDDMSSGHRDVLPAQVRLQVARCGDAEALDRIAADRAIDGVMHMAAKCSVGESMDYPERYYRANVRDSLDLLDWMVDRGVAWIIHSSTCAVYGTPERQPIDESTCPRPINAYGATKLAIDSAIEYYEQARALRGICLRYFNAAGAQADGTLGEDKTPASNLIPRVFSVALGQSEAIDILGDDYDSPDGTGVRDYIHVADLAAAHLAAMQKLADGGSGGVFNLGTGSGSSVRQVVEMAVKVSGRPITTRLAPRRAGDPGVLVAASQHAQDRLGWHPERSDLASILRDAWAWHTARPNGYRSDG